MRSSTLQGVAQTWAGLTCSAAHRACRQLLNDVWRQFTNISSPVTSNVNADLEYSREVSEVGVFEAPEAANTTILVVGGTGRCAVALIYGAHGPTPRAHPWMASASLCAKIGCTALLNSMSSGSIAQFKSRNADCSSGCVQSGRVLRRVGRVLVRKLVLRGYNVRVLARNKAQVAGILPSSVGIVEGDVGSPQTLREAVEGVDKARLLLLPKIVAQPCMLRVCSLAFWAP